jgi:hypothetical protein
MDIIDACLFRFEIPKTWKGTAIDLERELTADDCSMKQEARKLFSFYNAAATYLGRLAKKEPARFRQYRTNRERLWEISARDSKQEQSRLELKEFHLGGVE